MNELAAEIIPQENYRIWSKTHFEISSVNRAKDFNFPRESNESWNLSEHLTSLCSEAGEAVHTILKKTSALLVYLNDISQAPYLNLTK